MLTAQSRPTSSTSQPIQKTKAALAAWLESDFGERQRDKVLDAIAEEKAPAIQWFAAELRRAAAQPDQRRAKALQMILPRLAQRWLKVVEKSEMVYAGQYRILRPLQPQIAAIYWQFLLDTPQWFSIQDRIRVVPALRDLVPGPPDGDLVERTKEIATDEESEPHSLRQALWHALAQWGDRQLARRQIKTLEENARSENAEERIIALEKLASVHYQIRDYMSAAQVHRRFLQVAEKAGHSLAPVQFYNAACCASLSGDLRQAMKLITRCLQMNSSDETDSSWKIERKVFERDPEIRALRRHKDFRKLLNKAFPEPASKPKRTR